jgi:protoporphyrinogen oxidase
MQQQLINRLDNGRAQRESWAVVGGGFLGMTLALRLARAGRDVTLFESAPQLGGLAGAWTLGDVVWDRHYHVTLQSDRFLMALLRELGLESDLEWTQTRTGFYVDGKLYSMSNVAQFLGFPPLGLADKMRLGATILHASRIKDWKRLESVSAIDWLTKWSGRRCVDRLWRPLLRAKLGDDYGKASAAFIWAIIARMYAARRTGMKTERFGYVGGGYARVLARFEEVLKAAGVSVRAGTRVAAVERSPSGGVAIRFNETLSTRFDRAVVTMASPLSARLIRGLTDAETAAMSDVAYQGIVCASLLLRKPLAGYYVTNITDQWVPFTAVIEMSALVDRRYFQGNALVYLPKYVSPRDPLFEQPDDVLEKRFVDALARMYPNFDPQDVLAFRVSRVRYVLPISTLHYSDHLPPMATSIPGLWTIGSAHIVNGTLNVNETLALAESAAAMLLREGHAAPAQAGSAPESSLAAVS